MKIYMLGDFETDSGPGIANRTLKKGLEKIDQYNVYFYSKEKNLFQRIIENIYRSFTNDIVFVCDYTRLHILAMFIAHMAGKCVISRVHGHQSFERMINYYDTSQKEIKKIGIFEKYFYKYSNYIICVSALSAKKICNDFPEFSNRVGYCYNAIDINALKSCLTDDSLRKIKLSKNGNKTATILSIGGGMRIKNNIFIAESIRQLRLKTGEQYRFIVVGLPYTDKEELCSYPFVEYYDSLPHDELIRVMEQADIYIQNSSFETFGIAALESLMAGCDLLLSDKMGICEVFTTLEEDDLIRNVQDTNEIAYKINELLGNGNNKRLLKALCLDKIDPINVSEWFYNFFVTQGKLNRWK